MLWACPSPEEAGTPSLKRVQTNISFFVYQSFYDIECLDSRPALVHSSIYFKLKQIMKTQLKVVLFSQHCCNVISADQSLL